MATYDIEADVIIAESSTNIRRYGRADLDTTKTESVIYDPYTVPGSSTDLEIPLGSVATASVLYLETSSTETIEININGTGATAYSLSNGIILLKGVTVTSLHVTTAGVVDVDLVVIAFE